jgi:hypothetical protein
MIWLLFKDRENIKQITINKIIQRLRTPIKKFHFRRLFRWDPFILYKSKKVPQRGYFHRRTQNYWRIYIYSTKIGIIQDLFILLLLHRIQSEMVANLKIKKYPNRFWQYELDPDETRKTASNLHSNTAKSTKNHR